ncbi:hypothetical protein NP234_24255 [Salmonella enterica]|nr:hypothetical protein [Salmonella enterica]
MVAVDRVADMALGSIGAMADGVVPASVMMLVAFVLPGAVKLAVDFRPALAGVRLVLVDRVADMALDNVANYVGGMVDGIVPTCVAIFLTFIIPCAFKIVLNFAMSSRGK